jgi:hypothetical protein
MRLLFVFALASIFAGCQTPPPPPVNPAPDAADAARPDLAVAACAKLRADGCPLGSRQNCPAVFRLDPKFGADPACVLDGGAPLSSCGVTCE